MRTLWLVTSAQNWSKGSQISHISKPTNYYSPTMKLTATLTFALAASVSAFAPQTPSSSTKSSSLQMSDMPAQSDLIGYYTNLEERNAELDVKNLPASMNFDPFKFSDNSNGLFFQREAEIKHGRLAMLVCSLLLLYRPLPVWLLQVRLTFLTLSSTGGCWMAHCRTLGWKVGWLVRTDSGRR